MFTSIIVKKKQISVQQLYNVKYQNKTSLYQKVQIVVAFNIFILILYKYFELKVYFVILR